jgi:cation diffusion facilitator CzcD-associated flavoprotein CzcO
METETLIIGASSAGMAVARQLQERGKPYLQVERAAAVGQMWRNTYDRLHLHTTRSRSGLPFRPMPASYPRYPSRQQVIDYLESYRRELAQQPLFGREVRRIARDGDRWRAEVDGDSFTATRLVIATGNTRVPLRPKFEGEVAFNGPILHSSEYRTGATYRGQNVLVVGFGNSACEIAIDLCEQGARPTMAVRGAVNAIPRELLGIPIQNLGLIQQLFPVRLADAINAPILRLAVGDVRKLGLAKLPYGPIEQIRVHQQQPLLDIGTLALIRSGSIGIRPGIARFTPDGVEFADGQSGPFDAVILATGFRAKLGDLLSDVPDVLDADGTPLVSGGRTTAPGLYFCGFRITSGGALREAGLEAGRIADLVAAA